MICLWSEYSLKLLMFYAGSPLGVVAIDKLRVAARQEVQQTSPPCVSTGGSTVEDGLRTQKPVTNAASPPGLVISEVDACIAHIQRIDAGMCRQPAQRQQSGGEVGICAGFTVSSPA